MRLAPIIRNREPRTMCSTPLSLDRRDRSSLAATPDIHDQPSMNATRKTLIKLEKN
jgi:hypothetical protein